MKPVLYGLNVGVGCNLYVEILPPPQDDEIRRQGLSEMIKS